MAPPYVFVLDWDGTIAGRVDYQVQRYLLEQALKTQGFKPVKQHKIPPAFFPGAKLIRPGLSSFMTAMNRHLGDVVWFVYTASDKKWAQQEVKWVEETHGVKFQRPIFTRQDCVIRDGVVRKSITRILPQILRALSKRGVTVHDKKQLCQERLVVIDNNAVFIDHVDRLLVCPSYEYAVFENLLHGVPQEARNNPIVAQTMLSLMNQGFLCPSPSSNDDGMRALAKQYSWLAMKCRLVTKANKAHEHDRFWRILQGVIITNNIKVFTPKLIRQMQTAVWKNV